MNMTGRKALHKGGGNFCTYRIGVVWRWRTLKRAAKMDRTPRLRWFTDGKPYIFPTEGLHYVSFKTPEGWTR